MGRDWIRYSICLAFIIRSSTSSFLFAVVRATVCVRTSEARRLGEVGNGREEEGRKLNPQPTFKDVWGIRFFRVALFRYGYFVRDLCKVDTGSEIRDAA